MVAGAPRGATAGGPVRWHGLAEVGAARLGVLATPRGAIRTPAFAPVATRGALKGVLIRELPRTWFDLYLANTYHLLLRPGLETVEALGGLHRMLDWSGPILTDSGGFQVYSLAPLRRIREEGVEIRSHLDGRPLWLTPESVVEAQERMGSDIAMVLDICPALPAPRAELVAAVERTQRWARRALAARRAPERTALFAIVQGGTDPELRRRAARELTALPFDGFAVGGLSVGESADEMYATLDAVVPELPREKVRYLMGVGRPDNIVEAVARGIDLFDCVLPTRNARNGQLLTRRGMLNIGRAEFARDTRPVDEACDCLTCRTTSRGLLRHLFKTKELNYYHLATIHNLATMAWLMATIRRTLAEGDFAEFRAEIVAHYAKEAP